MEATLKIEVPASVWRDGLDPLATDWPKEHGIPQPEFRPRGRGKVCTYELTWDQLCDMEKHLRSLGVSWLQSDLTEAKNSGRRMLKCSEKLWQMICS